MPEQRGQTKLDDRPKQPALKQLAKPRDEKTA
jgi:hypothetical protein